jgi:hypothetical protein
MRQLYDVFERFPDGSTLWRACVVGRFEANRRMQEFAEHSHNEFFLLAIPGEDFLPVVPARRIERPLARSASAS